MSAAVEQLPQLCQQVEAVLARSGSSVITITSSKKPSTGPQAGQRFQRIGVIAIIARCEATCRAARFNASNSAFRPLPAARQNPARQLPLRFLQDIADALVGCRQCLGFRQGAEGAHGFNPWQPGRCGRGFCAMTASTTSAAKSRLVR